MSAITTMCPSAASPLAGSQEGSDTRGPRHDRSATAGSQIEVRFQSGNPMGSRP